ncbi:hypothetical protein KIN20_023107 [Parelaphostrongylus tenuis]|uniref:Exoribonuclease phosphorolytic domain-containing protein n=1 Tax=Parelaphostrongylus tenuis TaxID=148309 RepID=A0AAD5N676_PARTN|nr:hypothetical protein KIN20_023107 [Parelaphostrongylus tenuis]
MPFVNSHFSIPLDQLKRENSHVEEDQAGTTNFRPICMKCRVFDQSPGSAYVEFGETKVLARVYGPIEDANGEFSEAALSLKLVGIPETVEIEEQVLSMIRTCVMVHKYSQCTFEIEVTALNDDGGLLQCVIMAVTLALADAEVLVLDVVVAAHVARTPSGQINSGSNYSTNGSKLY